MDISSTIDSIESISSQSGAGCSRDDICILSKLHANSSLLFEKNKNKVLSHLVNLRSTLVRRENIEKNSSREKRRFETDLSDMVRRVKFKQELHCVVEKFYAKNKTRICFSPNNNNNNNKNKSRSQRDHVRRVLYATKQDVVSELEIMEDEEEGEFNVILGDFLMIEISFEGEEEEEEEEEKEEEGVQVSVTLTLGDSTDIELSDAGKELQKNIHTQNWKILAQNLKFLCEHSKRALLFHQNTTTTTTNNNNDANGDLLSEDGKVFALLQVPFLPDSSSQSPVSIEKSFYGTIVRFSSIIEIFTIHVLVKDDPSQIELRFQPPLALTGSMSRQFRTSAASPPVSSSSFPSFVPGELVNLAYLILNERGNNGRGGGGGGGHFPEALCCVESQLQLYSIEDDHRNNKAYTSLISNLSISISNIARCFEFICCYVLFYSILQSALVVEERAMEELKTRKAMEEEEEKEGFLKGKKKKKKKDKIHILLSPSTDSLGLTCKIRDLENFKLEIKILRNSKHISFPEVFLQGRKYQSLDELMISSSMSLPKILHRAHGIFTKQQQQQQQQQQELG